MATHPIITKQWQLDHHPIRPDEPIKDLFVLKDNVELSIPSGGEGGQFVTVKTKYLSNDPTQRGWVNKYDPNNRSYTKPVQPGAPMRSFGVGEVIESSSPNFTKGDIVFGFLNWTEYSIIRDDPSLPAPGVLTKLNDVDPVNYLALGVTALSAYFGLLHCGSATSSDNTIVVSGACGSTGSTAVQIAKKILNCPNVIGIAGSDEKCKIVTDTLGADHALNYKSPTFEDDFKKALGGKFIDVYFDNVGGKILELCLRNMGKHGRVVACGAISTYRGSDSSSGFSGISTSAWTQIIVQSLTVRGFILSDFSKEMEKGRTDLMSWIKEGKLKPLKTVWKAKFEEVPHGLEKLYEGENVGKLITELVE